MSHALAPHAAPAGDDLLVRQGTAPTPDPARAGADRAAARDAATGRARRELPAASTPPRTARVITVAMTTSTAFVIGGPADAAPRRTCSAHHAARCARSPCRPRPPSPSTGVDVVLISEAVTSRRTRASACTTTAGWWWPRPDTPPEASRARPADHAAAHRRRHRPAGLPVLGAGGEGGRLPRRPAGLRLPARPLPGRTRRRRRGPPPPGRRRDADARRPADRGVPVPAPRGWASTWCGTRTWATTTSSPGCGGYCSTPPGP